MYLSEKIIQFLKENSSNEKELNNSLKDPISYLLSFKIFENLSILEKTIFELENGEEVLITREGIDQLEREKMIDVVRIYDKKLIKLSLDEFIRHFSNTKMLDFIN